ncbi:SufB/SufD family protein [Treponema zioleckii]|uniref:SufB/SufD family protein n=1 Tax=Treponema zioleckii TaxID=331680 RepID=UPI00168A9BD5|nr:SufD family Fe-S cluster assembly protein [Treponema zioleckii]
MKQIYTFKELNKIPALTWNWLKMNRANLDVEAESDVISEKKEIVATKPNEKVSLHFDFEDGKTYEHEQIITARENSEITVIMDYSSAENASGFSKIRTKLVAEANAKIHLVKVQLLGSDFVQIDDTVGECADNAEIKVTQVELGGAKIFAQVKNDLNGFMSKFKSHTAYLCKDKQNFDFNYLVNHFGEKSDTRMWIKGVVDGEATKTYRGTIDFKNGCAESTGDEQEETLLMSPTVINKSIPIILCDEENVAGSHGSTIGRLSADELFYMQSRGITEDEAKKMMARAKIISVANQIPDSALVEKITTFIDK